MSTIPEQPFSRLLQTDDGKITSNRTNNAIKISFLFYINKSCYNYSFNFVFQDGVQLDVYLIQGDISVKIANAVIDTSSVLTNYNEKCDYTARLSSQNVFGTVKCWFKLSCNPQALSRVNV